MLDVDRDLILASTQGLVLRFSLSHGTFTLEDPARRFPVSSEAVAQVRLSSGEVLRSDRLSWSAADPESFEDAHGPGTRVVAVANDHLRLRMMLEFAVYDTPSLMLYRMFVENTGPIGRGIESLVPLVWEGGIVEVLRPGATSARWFRHGWQSWSPTLSLSLSERDVDVRPPVSAPSEVRARSGNIASEEVAFLLDISTQRGLLAGFVSARRQWTQVHIDASSRTLQAVANEDGVELSAGSRVESERFLLTFSDQPEAALRSYADVLAREMGARVPEEPPVGWCSWYYYFTTVSEEAILQNLRFLEMHRRELPVELVQIDDGYQQDIGDWTVTNEKFPRGMKALAGDISGAGFTPGIWLAPVLAGERSRLMKQHGDWMIVGDDEAPALAIGNWNQRNYALDCSNEDTERWLVDLFREVSGDWGYQYVKVDFMFAAAIAGRRNDPRATRIETYRRALTAIRKGVGEHRFVLGCGALMGASVGLIDAQRIGPDVAPWWRYQPRGAPIKRGKQRVSGEPATDNAIRNTLTRAWMHGRLWQNDADCLIARQERTKLTLDEVRTLATAIAFSGGAVLLSDNMVELSDERLRLISSLLPPLGVAAGVPGLLMESMPVTMRLDIHRPFESWGLLAKFNWKARRSEETVALPEGRWHVFNFWGARYLGSVEEEAHLTVPAHGVALLAFRPALGVPQLVGSTFHYSVGGKEVSNMLWDMQSMVLTVQLVPVAVSEGELYIHVPVPFRLGSASAEDRPIHVTVEDEVHRLHLRVDRPMKLVLAFAQQERPRPRRGPS